MSKHRLREHYGGWRPSLPDHRRVVADTAGLPVLNEVDPRAQMPAVFDQGQLGSCTANATAAAFRYDAILDGNDPGPLSRLWIYWQERSVESDLGKGDTGAYGSSAFKVAARIGVCPESAWPYNWAGGIDAGPPPETYFDPSAPPNAAVAGEGHYRLGKKYASVPPDEGEIKAALSNRQTVAFGFSVYESFESPQVAASGIVPMPGANEQQLGGHEILAVGYLREHPGYFLCRNSWGSRWGLGGYLLMPTAYLTSTDYSGDWTTIVRPSA